LTRIVSASTKRTSRTNRGRLPLKCSSLIASLDDWRATENTSWLF
jgi:hypothetical protein